MAGRLPKPHCSLFTSQSFSSFFLVVLEIDAHQVELESPGLVANNYPVPAALLGP
jgi:hypothetical protein